MTRRGGVRAGLAAAAVLVLAAAAAVALTRTAGPEAGGPAPQATGPAGATTAPAPASTPDLAVLDDPAAAEQAGAEAVLAAGLVAAEGPWAVLGDPAWPAAERPVYVVDAEVGGDRRSVTADVTVAWRAQAAASEVVLRLLGAAPALEAAGGGVEVVVRRDGRPASHDLDAAGARMTVTLDPALPAGAAGLLRIGLSLRLPDRATVTDDGTPATAGLLATGGGATTLGHWLPLLTVPPDDGPMVAWGDVGAFPVALWSAEITHPGVLLTGGADRPCPGRPAGCTQARGVALRDLSAVVLEPGAVTGEAAGMRVAAPAGTPGVAAAAAEAAAAASLFARRLGPLAWQEVDVVTAPLGSGAAGMEFPGLLLLDTGVTAALDGGFGSYVLAHEVAHQWFHALVGSGSLSSPVVDESLAQYLAFVFAAEQWGEAAAERLVRDRIAAAYGRARQAGLVDEPPAQSLDAFDSRGAYAALVYGRGALAWFAAEQAVGRDGVMGLLAALVRDAGLGFVDARAVVDAAARADPRIAGILERYWFDPDAVALR